MQAAIAALPDIVCPLCHASNADRQTHIKEWATHLGRHFECAVCGTAFITPIAVVGTPKGA